MATEQELIAVKAHIAHANLGAEYDGLLSDTLLCQVIDLIHDEEKKYDIIAEDSLSGSSNAKKPHNSTSNGESTPKPVLDIENFTGLGNNGESTPKPVLDIENFTCLGNNAIPYVISNTLAILSKIKIGVFKVNDLDTLPKKDDNSSAKAISDEWDHDPAFKPLRPLSKDTFIEYFVGALTHAIKDIYSEYNYNFNNAVANKLLAFYPAETLKARTKLVSKCVSAIVITSHGDTPVQQAKLHFYNPKIPTRLPTKTRDSAFEVAALISSIASIASSIVSIASIASIANIESLTALPADTHNSDVKEAASIANIANIANIESLAASIASNASNASLGMFSIIASNATYNALFEATRAKKLPITNASAQLDVIKPKLSLLLEQFTENYKQEKLKHNWFSWVYSWVYKNEDQKIKHHKEALYQSNLKNITQFQRLYREYLMGKKTYITTSPKEATTQEEEEEEQENNKTNAENDFLALENRLLALSAKVTQTAAVQWKYINNQIAVLNSERGILWRSMGWKTYAQQCLEQQRELMRNAFPDVIQPANILPVLMNPLTSTSSSALVSASSTATLNDSSDASTSSANPTKSNPLTEGDKKSDVTKQAHATVQSFKKVYKALRDGQTSPTKSNFIIELDQESDVDKQAIMIRNKANDERHSRTAKALKIVTDFTNVPNEATYQPMDLFKRIHPEAMNAGFSWSYNHTKVNPPDGKPPMIYEEFNALCQANPSSRAAKILAAMAA